MNLPCQDNTTCYERGDKDLWASDVVKGFPSKFKTHFTHGVGYDKAAGYVDGCEGDSCQNGTTCIDRITDHKRQCEPDLGERSCYVALGFSACEQVTCLNGGTCISWQAGENDHQGNCSYTPGLDGERYHYGMATIEQGTMFFTLQLDNSKQKMHSRLLTEYEGVTIGEDLNNTTIHTALATTNLSGNQIKDQVLVPNHSEVNDTKASDHSLGDAGIV